jgi:transcriptional regulator with XRE-family HTH domain
MPKASRATDPFAVEVRWLLDERGMSLRELGRRADVDVGHLSRLLRGADYRRSPSLDVVERVAVAFGLAPEYFVEFRAKWIAAQLDKDPTLLNQTFDRLRRRSSR